MSANHPPAPAPSSDWAVPWAIGQVLLGDYAVEGLLGQGGMGTVYLVRSQSTGQRFALKTILESRLGDEASRRSFLDELQVWIDLPEHPHLAACRFFRTVSDRIAIFAEYVEGGSLAGWIAKRKLTRLDQILDIAIQFAWGLHALHERGLIHQDVKPGNVLLTSDGIAKVSDFGLARARAAAGECEGGGAGQSILISCGGMTAAYCSPEQANRQPLSRKTDLWSWAVSVLEMFTGAVASRPGVAAPHALESYLATGPADPSLPAMPSGLTEVLRRCLRYDPAQRWASLAEVTEALRPIYRRVVGTDYPRPAPATSDRDRRVPVEHYRRSIRGVEWSDPREWLLKAFQADGRDPIEAEVLLPARTGSRKAQAIADLAGYDEARRIFGRLVVSGRKDLERDLADLCMHKASIHEYLDDIPGALESYDRAIATYERLVEREGRRELAGNLAIAYMNKATAVQDLGDARAAVGLHDRAIAILERLVERGGRRELAVNLASVYMSKAIAVADLGDLPAAVGLHDRAIATYERLVEREGRRELAGNLAIAYMNKAITVQQLGDLPAAVGLHDRAIATYERLVEREGRRELADALAMAYMNKACAVQELGDLPAAAGLHDRAIAIFERLVEREGRRELAGDLAEAYMSKATAVADPGDLPAAAELYDRAIAVYERLVEREGRRELAGNLARVYGNKAIAVRQLGDLPAAAELYDRAIAVYERLVEREGRRELAHDLAWVYGNKARAVRELGDLPAAVGLLDRAIAVYERLVEREGRRELAHALAMVYGNKACAVQELGDLPAAVELYDRAIATYERLVEREGRRELAGALARVYGNKANAVRQLGDLPAAVEL